MLCELSVMRRLAPLLIAAAATVFLTAAGQPAPQRLYQSYTDAQKADLDKVSSYLNGIRTLKSTFVQVGSDGGINQGTLYISKPGRIRFEYNPPSPLLMVATGGAFYVKNARLNTLDHYDLSDTPLGLLLNDAVDLARNKAVIGVSEQDGAIIVNARTSTNRNNSNITLVFSTPSLELRQWTVKDNQGGLTTVALRDLQIGAALDEALFTPLTKTAVARKQPN
jgi:outer membrane lipoprotein-sorting protein